MPLVTISLRAGKPDSYRQSLMDGVHAALHETFDMPEDNGFMLVHELEAANFRYSPAYLGVSRSDDLVFVQISAMNTRSPDQKKRLYKTIAENLSVHPGLRTEDVFVNLIEGSKDNWSLGLGLAQYS